MWPTKSEIEIGNIKDIALGSRHFLLLTEDGKLYFWGMKGKVISGGHMTTPVEMEVFKGKKILKIFSGEEKAAALVEE